MMPEHTRKFILGLIAGAALLSLIAPRNPAASQEAYVLGIFPSLPPAKLVDTYGGLVGIFSKSLGRKVNFRTKSTFKAFKAAVLKQAYDIALLQPIDYVEVAERAGYRPIARGADPLSATFVVHSKSAIKSLADLSGKRIAAPPRSAAVRYLGLAKLEEFGLRPGVDFRLLSLPSHPACLQAVLIRDAEACVTTTIPIELFGGGNRASFRIVAKSRAIPHVVFVAHSRVLGSDRENLREMLLGLGRTEEGRRLLHRIRRPKGFIAYADSDYDVVRALSKKFSDR